MACSSFGPPALVIVNSCHHKVKPLFYGKTSEICCMPFLVGAAASVTVSCSENILNVNI